MLFSSFGYIFLFLPITFFVYFYLNFLKKTIGARVWLVLASLFFYAYWKISYLPIILISLLVNYCFGYALLSKARLLSSKKLLVICGICFNVLLLGYYKYSDFVISNLNAACHIHLPLLNIILPLGISFFTFTQIAYLIDVYKRKVKEYSLLNYALFVTYFPHLLAGPIIHHSEMMPQFSNIRAKIVRYKNIWMGIVLFSIGFFKKIVLADTYAIWANQGFDHTSILTFLSAWSTSLSYSLQLYFDFSGYTDMAIGVSLMFNIILPINFNSPYKALGIQDFWQRWHMTLSRFLRDYIYIPLGGNRVGNLRLYENLMITFLIGGIWHGAGWTFVFWGFLHGFGLVVQRIWRGFNFVLPRVVAWVITFNFVNFAWVFFRAKSWHDAVKVLSGMFSCNSVHGFNLVVWLSIVIGLVIVLFAKNSNEIIRSRRIYKKKMVFLVGVIFIISIVFLNVRGGSEFIYFQF